MRITAIHVGALAVCLSFMVNAACASNTVPIKTDRGRVAGEVAGNGKVSAFLGIPYAKPPIGPLRWKAPQMAEKWHGVRQATAFGARCMQPALYQDMVFRDPGNNEDCLTLNVWTPSLKKDAKLPVMVWIYGGGFITGGTSEARQDGEHLASKGVVVVSMNYRLGIFGFFAHRSLAAENTQHSSGNYGLMDQAAALAWAKRNITAFGGDPTNITIFGESAGSFSVSAQMASPVSKNLIQRAIGESGGAFGPGELSFPSRAEAEKEAEAFALSSLGTDDLAELRAMSAERLLSSAGSEGPGSPRFIPDIDGYFLPQSVSAIYAEGKQAHVPLLAGWNRDEDTSSSAIENGKSSVESLHAMAKKEFGPDADRFLKAYAAANEQEALRVAQDYAGDRFIAFSTWDWLEAQVRTGESAVYRYSFDRPSPGDPNHPISAGAFHSDDIEYVFGNLDARSGAKWATADYRLSELVQDYWTAFARTGVPSASEAPVWRSYNGTDDWQVMHLDALPRVVADQHRDRYLFLQSLPGEKR